MSVDASTAAARLLATADQGELAGVCARRKIALLVLFGSAAGGDTQPGDVDVAVLFERGADPDVLGLLQDLYELTGYEGYDVLDLGRAGVVARERALVGARLLVEATPGIFATEQIRATMERMDTDELRRMQLELMSQ